MRFLPPAAGRHRFFWPLLLVALALTTVLPIGIHTVMLDNLGIPYPSAFPRNGWAAFPDHALVVVGAISLNALLERDRQGWPSVWRGLFVFLAVAAINQALFRVPVMRNIVSTKWTIYPFIDNLPVVLRFTVMAALVVGVRRLLTTTARKLGAAMLIAALVYEIVAPWLDVLFAGIIAANGNREGDQLYTVPYDWHVDVPSYLTYVEPTLAPKSPGRRPY